MQNFNYNFILFSNYLLIIILLLGYVIISKSDMHTSNQVQPSYLVHKLQPKEFTNHRYIHVLNSLQCLAYRDCSVTCLILYTLFTRHKAIVIILNDNN